MNEQTKNFTNSFLKNFLNDEMQDLIELPDNIVTFYKQNESNSSNIIFDEKDHYELEMLTKTTCKKYCKGIDSYKSQKFIISEEYKNEFLKQSTEKIKEIKYKNENEVLKIIEIIINNAFLESLEYQNVRHQVFSGFSGKLKIDLKSNESYDLSGIEKDVNEFKKEIEDSKRKTNEISISILGIFSALVLAFNGATIFTSATLESINTTSIYRLVAIVILIGTVFINIAYALFNFIGDLIERNSLEEEHQKISFIKFNSGKHLLIVNIVALVSIMIIILCWRFGAVENRNQYVENSLTTTQSTNEANLQENFTEEDFSKETISTTISNK